MDSRAEILCEDGRLNWSRSFVRPVVRLELPYVISFSYVVSAAPNCGSMTASLLLRLQPNLDSFVAWYRCCSKLLRVWIVSEARLLPMSSTTLPGIFSLTLFDKSIDKIAPFPSCRPPP